MNTQDRSERACATRGNRKTTQNGVLREAPTRINGVPTGKNQGMNITPVLFRGLILKRVKLCRRKAEKGGS